MTEWLNFALALAAFFASHAIPAIPAVKGRLKAVLGKAGYGAFFGIVSIVVLVWVIAAAGSAPFVVIWDQYPWMRWVVNMTMPLALLLAVLAIGAPNPLSFGGREDGFDPARPGLAGLVRHPLLWALLLWSASHMLVNGDLAHVILFGTFTVFCIAGMPMLDRRKQRQLGAHEWRRLASRTSNIPSFPGLAGNVAAAVTLPRLAIAAATWIALLAAHPFVIGASPLP